MVSPGFEPAMHEAVECYREVYGGTLVAVYYIGSVHRGEAVLGLSDIDIRAFVSKPPPPAARERLYAISDTRLAPWPHASDAMTQARTLEERFAGARPGASAQERRLYRLLTFGLRYDSTRAYGEDVLVGHPVPAPDAAFARQFLCSALLETIRLAKIGKQHREVPLPQEPVARLRKLGRLAVLCGASVLMARGRFRSLRGADVLPILDAADPSWTVFLQDTARCYIEVQPEAPDYDSYLHTLAAFAEWCWQQVQANL